MEKFDINKYRRQMTAETAKIDEARAHYPDAPESELMRIAEGAAVAAELFEAKGIAEGRAFSACQSEYGCDWEWGTGVVTRDEWGRIVPDPDAKPTARVYDCDGETLGLFI